ncbi:TPA: ead/Ea22-like family protein [Escherichia coli]|uniref:ead/Ea22-like family protein n=1 Tax=Escherichia coli TaxID=562 RepID=UPI000B7CC879|nr:ead/Ea22-like family protein [Escherichia coli]HBH7437252.1 ead/Ea22-like family protein [Escherichia coli]HBH7458739.1 ead/Ea22-like family protein [Escherichia coli]HBI8231791.1 ead/Ea22-like family protein [Escherichia coli]HCO5029842.1 ead/Ea22-like family protein [Escherichia coli]HCO5037858.1 ead/Ea22-like family protein [Escherichia coli]
MNKIDYQALREAAEKAGEDKWQAKKINGDFFVIRHGSYTRQHGYTSYQPIAEIDCKPVRDFVAKANPATVLALLDERERNQQYIKRRDQENKDIALTVGKLRVELEAANKRIAELEAGPVSQAYNLAELIEGMEVSIDVSTCDADLGNRYFGTVTEALELDTAKNGYILLVQDAEPNFDVNGNYPVTPDGWISCSERMPDDGQHVIILCDGAFVLYAQYRDGEFFDIVRNGDEFFETQSRNVTNWMPLPEPPQEAK